MSRFPSFLLVLGALGPAAFAGARDPLPSPPSPMGFPVAVPGTVVDLYRSASGNLLYCTLEGDVGLVTTAGGITILANAASGPFQFALKAIVETAQGDVAVLDDVGDIWVLPGGATPAVRRYDDAFMIAAPTDMILDATGNFVIASQTPSNQLQGVNWVSADGARWAYYKVQHSPLFRPIQLAADPTNGNVIAADQEFGGILWCMEAAEPTHALCPLDTTTLYGYTTAAYDGDLAVEANGNVLVIAGGLLLRWNRASGFASVVASGFGPLRGLTIAPSSGSVPSGTGWSAYLAEGGAPTTLREVGGVQPPASQVVAPLGTVPGKGIQRMFYGQIKVYDIETDLNGNFLVGGDLFGASKSVRRISVPSLTMSIVAGEADGILDRIEGIVVHPDGVIFALDVNGVIYEIHENPKSVTIYYPDAGNVITYGYDLALSRDGTMYVADREAWGFGEVRAVLPGGIGTAQVTSTQETRGVCADPNGPGLYLSEWVNTGFTSKGTQWSFPAQSKTNLFGFTGINITNGTGWGDGDNVVDVEGFVYTLSEDDWSLSRWKPGRAGVERVGSGYLQHPSGLTIAPSMSPSSTTGWSLYVSEFDFLYEISGVPPPAPDIVDPGAPPVGKLVGYTHPLFGRPRAVVADPNGGGMLLATTAGVLLRMASDGSVAIVAAGGQGLSGDLRAAARRPNGHLLLANSNGLVWDVNPFGWGVTLVFADPLDQLHDVRGLAVDGMDRPLLVDRAAGRPVSKLYRLSGGSLEFLSFTNRGVRPAVDPLTADVFVTQQGHADEPGGEVLRVNELVSPPAIGNWRGDLFYMFAVGELDGGIAFDSSGNFYVAEGRTGRILRVDRASGVKTIATGNYSNPSGLVLAPGTPGVAGPQGTSLFVLDGHVMYEVGVDGLPAGNPPAVNPGLAPPTDIRLQGLATLGGGVSVRVTRASEAGKLFVIFPSYEGHVPGLPLAFIRDPSDPRIIASNPDYLWDSIADPTLFPGFYSFLDGTGSNPPTSGILIPNIPQLMNDSFIDMNWVVIDGLAQNLISFVGGTTQLFLGLP